MLLEEGEPGPFRLARRLSRAAFEQRHRELAAQGFRLHDLEIVSEAPEPCFAGLWYYGRGEQRIDLGSPAGPFALGHLGSAFVSVVDVESYMDGGERLFAGVWREGAPDLELALDIDETTVRQLAAAGRRLADVESWPTPDGRRYMLLHGASSAPLELRLHQSPRDFDSDVAALIGDGFRPVELEIDAEGTKPRYTSVWERASEAFWLFAGLDERLQDCRIVSLGLEAPELRPVDLARCRALRRAGADRGRSEEDQPLDVLELPSEPLRLIDFAFSRLPLDLLDEVCPDCVIRHEGVLHDTGPSGPSS